MDHVRFWSITSGPHLFGSQPDCLLQRLWIKVTRPSTGSSTARRRLDPVYHFRVGHFGKFEFIFGSSSLRAGEQYSAARRIAISAQVSSEGTLPIIFIIKYIHQ